MKRICAPAVAMGCHRLCRLDMLHPSERIQLNNGGRAVLRLYKRHLHQRPVAIPRACPRPWFVWAGAVGKQGLVRNVQVATAGAARQEYGLKPTFDVAHDEAVAITIEVQLRNGAARAHNVYMW